MRAAAFTFVAGPIVFGLILLVASCSDGIRTVNLTMPAEWTDPKTGCEFLIFESASGSIDAERRDPSCGITP